MAEIFFCPECSDAVEVEPNFDEETGTCPECGWVGGLEDCTSDYNDEEEEFFDEDDNYGEPIDGEEYAEHDID